MDTALEIPNKSQENLENRETSRETERCSVRLSNGMVAFVDAEDFARVNARRWQALRSRNGLVYAQTTWAVERGRGGKKKAISMHRFIACALPGQTIDHEDGNGLNNTRSNLRYATQRQNCENKVRSTNGRRRGGYKGVSFLKRAGKWCAYICAGPLKPNGERKQVHLGLFKDPVDAARAYDRAAIVAFGEFASLNFPEPANETERKAGGS